MPLYNHHNTFCQQTKNKYILPYKHRFVFAPRVCPEAHGPPVSQWEQWAAPYTEHCPSAASPEEPTAIRTITRKKHLNIEVYLCLRIPELHWNTFNNNNKQVNGAELGFLTPTCWINWAFVIPFASAILSLFLSLEDKFSAYSYCTRLLLISELWTNVDLVTLLTQASCLHSLLFFLQSNNLFRNCANFWTDKSLL